MTLSRIFLYFCLSFVGGIFISSIFNITQPIMLGFLILGLILISALWRYKKFVVVGFCLIFLVLGIWREQTAILAMPTVEEKEVSFVGQVVQEPNVGTNSTRLIVNEVSPQSMRGKVLINTWRYPEYQYGDKLKITGKLEKPAEDINGWNYRDYLKKDGIYAVIEWPKIEFLGSGFGSSIMSVLFSFKNKFKEATGRFISPPQQGILEALIFGDEENISKDWKDKLNLTGTRHICAVSGMNITILSSLILSFALGIGMWRRHAFYLSLFLLFLYILMIGAPASAVRAGIMAGILIVAQYFGRLSQATRAVVFAATLMLFFNPLLLKLDVGFQLSFLATVGIVHLAPFFKRWLKSATLSMTLAAQVFTLPILIYNFGYFSLLSPFTNILIVPILASLTILIFIFGLTSIIFNPLGHLLSWPTWLSLTYITSIIDWFSKIPFASITFHLSWIWLLVVYVFLSLVVWRLNQSRKLW